MAASWWIFCLSILVLFIASLATGIIGRINRNPQPDLNWFLQSDEAKLSALNHGATGAILKVWTRYYVDTTSINLLYARIYFWLPAVM